VHFSDTDAAGVVHFSRLLSYVEEAEHSWFEELGWEVYSAKHGWPRVALESQFVSPARFGDELLFTLFIEKISTSTITYNFYGAIASGPSKGREVLRGSMTACYVTIGEDGQMRPAPLPLSGMSATG
jgi:YbgC/YbaW family acyl-CoA thioester hydrolase